MTASKTHLRADQVKLKLGENGKLLINWGFGEGWEPIQRYHKTIVDFEPVDVRAA